MKKALFAIPGLLFLLSCGSGGGGGDSIFSPDDVDAGGSAQVDKNTIDIATLVSRVDALETDLASEKTKSSTLQTSHETLRSEYDTLVTKYNSLETEHNTLKAKDDAILKKPTSGGEFDCAPFLLGTTWAGKLKSGNSLSRWWDHTITFSNATECIATVTIKFVSSNIPTTIIPGINYKVFHIDDGVINFVHHDFTGNGDEFEEIGSLVNVRVSTDGNTMTAINFLAHEKLTFNCSGNTCAMPHYEMALTRQ